MNERQKNILRRIIRITTGVIGGFLLLIALAIPVANNAVALGVEKRLKSLPLPEQTVLTDSVSRAGKMTGSGNGMQYFGAILIKSDLSLTELQAYYRSLSPDTLTTRAVAKQTGQTVVDAGKNAPAFSAPVTGDQMYAVYEWGSVSSFWQGILDLDLRGH